MMDLQKSVWRALDFVQDHPSALYTKTNKHNISQLLPRWLAKRDIAAGDDYRRQGFSDLYGRSHGLRKGTFDGFDQTHESLGKERRELYGLATDPGSSQEELAIKSKTYKRKAKEFYGMVKGRTKGIPPRPIDFNNPYSSFLTPPSSPASDRSFSPPSSNVTVNVACGSVNSHTGCTSPTSTDTNGDHEHPPADSARVAVNGHTRAASYTYKQGQPFLTVNVTAPPPGLSPCLSASSVPDTPETGCQSCPPTPTTSQFDKAEIRLPGFSPVANEFDEPELTQRSVLAEGKPKGTLPSLPPRTASQDADSDMLSQLSEFGFPPGFVPFNTEQLNAGTQFPDPPLLSHTQSPVIYETAQSCWPPAPPTPSVASWDDGFAQGNLLGLVNGDIQVPHPATVSPDVNSRDVLRQLPPLSPRMSSGESLYRANLVDWIKRCLPDAITIHESRQAMLHGLSTDALTQIMTVFHDEGVDAGMSLIEHHWSVLANRHLEKLSEDSNCTRFGSPPAQRRASGAEEALSWPPAPVLRARSLESEPPVQPFRRLTNESDLSTLLFNRNNSPIPRNALGPLTTWQEAVNFIHTYLNPIQEELAGPLLSALDVDKVVDIAEVFRDQGPFRGITYLDVEWNKWMEKFRQFGDPRRPPSAAPAASTVTMEPYPLWMTYSASTFGLPLTSSPQQMPATLPSVYSETPAQMATFYPHHLAQGNALFTAEPVIPNYTRLLATHRAEAIAQWVESVTAPQVNDAPVSQEDNRPSSCMLDHIERGGERDLDATSTAFTPATAGHGLEQVTVPVWSMPGIHGLPAHLAAQNHIWGL